MKEIAAGSSGNVQAMAIKPDVLFIRSSQHRFDLFHVFVISYSRKDYCMTETAHSLRHEEKLFADSAHQRSNGKE